MIPVEKIYEAILEQAKQGSCKTCRWCVLVDDTGTRYCAMEGNTEPIIDPQTLDATEYPTICQCGCWSNFKQGEPVRACMAYQLGTLAIQNMEPGIYDAATKHLEFMFDLADAIRIYSAIQNNTLAKLTAKLNEAKESLPAVPAMSRI